MDNEGYKPELDPGLDENGAVVAHLESTDVKKTESPILPITVETTSSMMPSHGASSVPHKSYQSMNTKLDMELPRKKDVKPIALKPYAGEALRSCQQLWSEGGVGEV